MGGPADSRTGTQRPPVRPSAGPSSSASSQYTAASDPATTRGAATPRAARRNRPRASLAPRAARFYVWRPPCPPISPRCVVACNRHSGRNLRLAPCWARGASRRCSACGTRRCPATSRSRFSTSASRPPRRWRSASCARRALSRGSSTRTSCRSTRSAGTGTRSSTSRCGAWTARRCASSWSATSACPSATRRALRGRLRTPSRTPIAKASSTAISSPTTSCSMPPDTCSLPTSGSPRRPTMRPRRS